MQSKEILDAVFNMARIGLAEVAKDTRNGPAQVAQAASILEAWRASCEQRLTDAAKVAADAKAKP